MEMIKRGFNWVSKHFAILSAIIGLLSIFVFTVIFPLLLQTVCLPVWVIVALLPIPLLFNRIYLIYFGKRRVFKGGEQVRLKGGNKVLFINGYTWFSLSMVNCSDYTGVVTTFHHKAVEPC